MVVSNIVYFHPCLGKIPILTNIFKRGGNHQLAIFFPNVSSGGVLPVSACPTETTTSWLESTDHWSNFECLKNKDPEKMQLPQVPIQMVHIWILSEISRFWMVVRWCLMVRNPKHHQGSYLTTGSSTRCQGEKRTCNLFQEQLRLEISV